MNDWQFQFLDKTWNVSWDGLMFHWSDSDGLPIKQPPNGSQQWKILRDLIKKQAHAKVERDFADFDELHETV